MIISEIQCERARTLLQAILATASLVACMAVGGICQDPFSGTDPFSSSGDPFASGADSADPLDAPVSNPISSATTPRSGTASNAAVPDSELDPVIRHLRQTKMETPEHYAEALGWLLKLRNWEELNRLIAEVEAKQFDLSALAALARELGSDQLMRMQRTPNELSDASKATLRKISQAPSQLARDPANLNRLWKQLANSNPAERALAKLKFRDGGQTSIAFLVNKLLDGSAAAIATEVADAVMQFGDDGIDALKGAMFAADPQQAARVVLAVSQLPSSHFSSELGASLYSQRMPADTKSELQRILIERFGRLPSEDQTRQYLNRRFEEQRAQFDLLKSSPTETQTTIWRMSTDRKTVAPVVVSASDAVLESLARLGSLRFYFEQSDAKAIVDSLAIQMHRAYRVDPSLYTSDFQKAMLISLASTNNLKIDGWISVYQACREAKMSGGAVRTLQWIAELTRQGKVEMPLEFYSQQLRDGRSLIRYSAAQAIASLDPKTSYSGADAMLDVSLEMLKLADGPQALVIGQQSDLREAAAGIFEGLTAAGAANASTARAAITVLESTEPIEMVIIVDRIPDMSLYELIQRVRNSRRGESLPIVVTTDQLYQHERELIAAAPNVITSALSHDRAYMGEVLKRTLDRFDTNPMTAEERIEFSTIAARFFSQIATDRETYRFYHINDLYEHLVSAQANVSRLAQVHVLSGLRSPDAQKTLIDLASNSSASEAERTAAAKAFGSSIKQFGQLLDRQAVLNVYSLYNTVGPTDPVAARTIGFILDVIEAQAGKRSWPDDL